MTKLIPTLLMLAVSCSLSAQDWKQSLSAGLNMARGNTENTQINASYDASRKRVLDTLKFKLAVNYGKDDVQKNTDNYFIESQYNRVISNRLFWLINGSYETDSIADLDYRYAISPGLGYKVIERRNHTWDIEGGIGYQDEKFDLTRSDDSIAYRAAEKWNYALSETSSLWHSAEISGDVSNGEDYILKAVIGVQSKVAGNLSLKSFVEDKYTAEPAKNKKQNDVSFNTVLVYSF